MEVAPDSIPLLSSERVRGIFSRFGSARIVVLGDVMLDAYLRGFVDCISPEAPVPVVKVTGDSVMLGGAANVASNIAALGADPFLVGVVGDDAAGKELREAMERNGLSADGIVVDGSRPTTRKTRVVASKQQVVRVDREAVHDVDEKTAGQLLKIVEKALESADALLLQDYNKGVLSPAVIKAVTDAARRMRKVVTVDPKFQNFFEYKEVTLFKPNIRELKHALGSVQPDSRNIDRMMTDLKARNGSRHILLTCGEDGMVLLDEKGDFTRVPAICREVYDVSGAGDTVISAVTLGLACGGEAWESSIISNYAASVEVQRSGVSTVTRDEIFTAMRIHGGLVEP